MNLTQQSPLSNSILESNQPLITSRPLSVEQVNQYHEDGFIIIPQFFESEEIEPLQRLLENDPDLNGYWTQRNTNKQGDNFRVSVWTELGNTLFGVIPRIARMVDATEALLGEPCYHWHSKIVKVQPGNSGLAWHQDYDHWYQDGCLFPQLLTCTIALSPTNKDNGCLQVIKKSHLLGRINHIIVEDKGYQNIPESKRLAKILEKFEVVYCEIEPGDAIFFHANTLHGSGFNASDTSRLLMHCSYNAVNNVPFIQEGQDHHQYRPLIKLPDSIIKEGGYDSVWQQHEFHPSETENSLGKGVFYRQAWTS
ncbi:MAG: phytanoyl-CoA dioxygenase family protein [Coleofasciculus sp. A1-SPW-01]|uniref:phytanoyl-CoA dioxygenase family protein n=1 Tax=Coleofasciculus sp. A1-SPW-01 TaxID=3070819 RepID=UPI0032F41EB2